MIEIYTLNSVTAALSLKESIQTLYAQCLGLQMKILRDYPKTVGQLIDSLLALPRELDIIVCLNVYEVAKNLPEEMLKGDILRKACPLIFISRFSMNDHRLKTLARKAHSFLLEHIPDLIESSQEPILRLILQWLDSSSYDDRVSASQAMQEVCARLQEEDFRDSPAARDVVDKLHGLIQGKYFNSKEKVVEGFSALIATANLARTNGPFINTYLGETCFKQVEKHLSSHLAYKNQILTSMKPLLETSPLVSDQVKLSLFELLSTDTRVCLQKVSEKAAMIESLDELEEKREDDKHTLQSAILELECAPYLIVNDA